MTTAVYKAFKLFVTLAVAIWVLLFLCPTVFCKDSRLYLNIKKQTLSANIKNTALRDVIKEIEAEKKIWFNTGFMRDKSLLDDDISMKFGNVSIQEGLDRILSGINYSLFFKGNKVVGVMLLGRPAKRAYRGRSATRRIPARRTPFTRAGRRP